MDHVDSAEQLRDQLRNAPEAPQGDADAQSGPQDADGPGFGPDPTAEADSGGNNARSADGDRPLGELYDGCPITPLGVRGDYVYCLDVLGQLRSVKKIDMGVLTNLFGRESDQLVSHYPVWKNIAEKGENPDWIREPKRFKASDVTFDLYTAASECGVFNPDNTVRGVGSWQDDDGNLVYHAGDGVMIGGEWRKPGRIAGRIYPAYPPIPRPDQNPDMKDPVPDILATLETWNWTSKDTHPWLALGLIGIQMLGGALDWRPVFWLLAPAGAGKSELQKLMKLLHGDDGLVQSTDTTKSGITSKLGHSSLPVAVDELEPGDERSTKERDIIQLARVAASGGEWYRGSSDQSGVGGKVYSAFLFSSILIPGSMKTQDVQRLIRLELKPLDKYTQKLNLQPRTWRARGARLKALLIQRWGTWNERLAMWRLALEQHEVTGRDADNWATVLAMADMAASEDLPREDDMANWAKKIAFLAHADREETHNDAQAMMLWLMSQPLDPFRRGEQHTVAQWVMGAAGLPGAPEGIIPNDADLDLSVRRSRLNATLAKYGLRVKGVGQDAEIFIGNQVIHNLNELFKGSQWHGGAWKQSASRVPGATSSDSALTLAGVRTRGWFIPVKVVDGLMNFPMDRKPDDAPEAPLDDANDPDNWG